MTDTKMSDEVRKAVLERGGKVSDRLISEETGIPENQIWRARKALGIPAFRKHGDTEAKREIVQREYIDLGKSASVVGAMMGLTERQVRKIAYSAGMVRSPEVARANAIANKPVRVPTVKPENAVSDADLIADFIARKGVTKLADGIACGLTRWEGQLHTAYPANSFRQRNAADYPNSKRVA